METIKKLNASLLSAQEVLARYIVPDSVMSDSDCIDALLSILDNKDLVNLQSTLKVERKLCTITNKEMKELAILSGECSKSSKITIKRVRDEDEQVRYIVAHCVTTHNDKSQSKCDIQINVYGLIYMRHYHHKPCDNTCCRDVCCNQVEMIDWLRSKGFVFPDSQEDLSCN